MARGTRGESSGVTESLYSDPITAGTDTDADSGDRGAGEDTGESPGYDGFADTPAEPARKPRKPRARRAPAETSPVAAHSRAQIRGLTKSIGLTAQGAFSAIAQMRTMTLGFIPDPSSPTGVLMKADGMPMGAGECWLLDRKSAMELGEAWAEVVALYCPPELVERSAVLSTAATTTAMIVATRLFADIQTQAMIKQVAAVRGEFNVNGAQPSYTGMDYSEGVREVPTPATAGAE